MYKMYNMLAAHCIRVDDLFFLVLFTSDFNDICTAGTAVILFDSDHKNKILNIHISRCIS